MRDDSYTIPIERRFLQELAKWYKKYLLDGSYQARDGVDLMVESILEDANLAWWTDDGK